jgi:hypothetical protein
LRHGRGGTLAWRSRQDGCDGRRLGLERLEGAQRPRKLGLGGAAIAQQGVERARAVAVADQREAEVAIAEHAVHLAREQLGLDALGALEPPGGAGDARGEQALQGAIGGQLLDQRRFERRELGRLLVADDDEFLRAETVLECVLRRSRLPFGGLRPARLGAVPATRLGTGIADGNHRARRGACTRHGGFLAGWRELAGGGGGPRRVGRQTPV